MLGAQEHSAQGVVCGLLPYQLSYWYIGDVYSLHRVMTIFIFDPFPAKHHT